MRDAISRLDMRKKSIPQRITVFLFFFKLSKKKHLLIFFFYGHGKFGVHGRFAIYWISRNNGPRCIGSLVYIENFKNLLVRNDWTDFNIILQKCSFGDPLPRLLKLFGFVKKHGCQGVGLIFSIYLYRKL